MKLRIFSDLHLEFWSFDPPAVDADVIVLAGDIGEGDAGMKWAREQFPREPIIYVVGNHELYEQRLPDAMADFTQTAQALGIHLLENQALVLDEVRFLGATLWTDYAIFAKNDEAVDRYMFAAKRLMNDYRVIRHGPKRKKGRDRIQPTFVREMHRFSRTWLAAQLAEPFAGSTVVVTHHAPHEMSVPPRYAGRELTPCYASHLPELVRAPVKLWIHGHIHDSIDYEVGGARVLSNPRGYKPPNDNPAFDPELVVEV